MSTQADKVLKYMKTGRPISALTAVRRFAIYRLASRIYDLKRAGVSIKSRRVTRAGKSWSVYSWP